MLDFSQFEIDCAIVRSLRRIGLQGRRDIHPIERVQVIEVDHVILHHLRARRSGCARGGRFRGTSILSASSTARTLAMAWTMVQTPQMRCAQIQASRGSRPCRIIFDAAEHGAGTPGVGYLAAIQIGFNAKMAFNAGDGIDNDACHFQFSFPAGPAAVGGLWRRRFDHLDRGRAR